MKELTTGYGPLFLMFLMVALMGVGMIVASHIFGRKKSHKNKMDPFECGMPLLDSVRKRLSVKFFIIAVLFIIFDVEIAFLYPWALVAREATWFMLGAVGVFILFLGMVYAYLWKKGAFRWEK